MENSKFESFKENFLAAWQNLVEKSNEDDAIAFVGRERIVVFLVSLILALCLWLMVNLSLDYNLNMDFPISLGAIPVDQALAEDLPEKANVNVTGEGWKLINIYNNPPLIRVNVNKAEVNLYDQVQKQLNDLSNISVQKVQPLFLTLDLEKRVSKKVPVQSVADISFDDQYNVVGKTTLQPDSVTISGAISLVDKINVWPTDTLHLADVSKDLSEKVNLKQPDKLVTLSTDYVTYHASVAQYTEGEAKVKIQTKNIPAGKDIHYSPDAITIKYEVPIEEYGLIKGQNPFKLFVTYEQIQKDSTGFIKPEIEQSANKYHINIRAIQPPRVAYFMVLKE